MSYWAAMKKTKTFKIVTRASSEYRTWKFFSIVCEILYARHHNPLLIRNHSWILIIDKARILRKKPIEKTFLDFKKWIKSLQTACMVDISNDKKGKFK